MFGNGRRLLKDPVFLLALAAGLIAFVVQSGDVDSADTARRLQTTHSFWTSAPPVLRGDYPEFGLRGSNGRIYAWYGIGQSLLMLPADIVGTYVEKLPIFAEYNGNDPSVRYIIVSYSTNILINVLTALVCFRFLTLLKFTQTQAAAGVLALLACTTHLHYTQNMMENNYILLLTLTGFSFQYEWLLTGSRTALAIGSAAFGLNLLTRLTTGMDLIAGGIFLLLVLLYTHQSLGPDLVEGSPLRVDRISHLRRVSSDRPCVPVLSLRLVLRYLHHSVRAAAARAQSSAAGELSV